MVCTLAGDGALLVRTHQGLLALAVDTPRRPPATLQVATHGTLVVGSDGITSAGSFRIATGRDSVSVVHADTLVSVALDLGNDGSVERRWTLTRGAFSAEAG